MNYYIKYPSSTPSGPHSESEIVEWYKKGFITKDAMIGAANGTEWEPILRFLVVRGYGIPTPSSDNGSPRRPGKGRRASSSTHLPFKPPQSDGPSPAASPVSGGIGGLGGAALVFLCMHFYTKSKNTTTAHPSAATPTWHWVDYKVEGSADQVNLTYTNSSGNTEQREGVVLPWSTRMFLRAGTHVYVSAQNNTKYGSVTCRIYSDGVLISNSTSSGAYTIASASKLLE